MSIDTISVTLSLSQAAELGILFSWTCDCDSGLLDIQAPAAILSGHALSSPEEVQEFFQQYINVVPDEKQKKFKDILNGTISDNTGEFNYSVIYEGQTFYHKCKYNRLVQNNKTQIFGTISKNTDNLNTKILETIPDFIFIFDRNFFIRGIMKSRSISLLHPVEELINSDGRLFYSPNVSAQYLEAIDLCLRQQSLVEIEYPLDVESGRYYFQARMVPFEEDKVLALIHDTTEKVERTLEFIQAKQKAEEADHMKSTFLANMSHEIRTPLNAIVGFSELLVATDDSQEKKEYYDIIQTNSQLLLQLINDILDLSRIESGKTAVLLKPTDLNSLLEEIKQIHEVKMKSGIVLRIDEPQEKICIMTDPQRVTQVLFNFMSNAIKNTNQGYITLGLSRSNKEICLSVTDTGRGIPKDQLEIIFERFIKINDFVQGTGLGLAICRTIADKLKGRIHVESEYGTGSTFSLYLPLIPAEP